MNAIAAARAADAGRIDPPTAGPAAAADPARLESSGLAVTLPNGLPGFPAATRFRLTPLPGNGGDAPGPFRLLGASDGAGPTFVVAPLAPDAGLIERPDIERACRDLGLDPGRALVLLILNPRPKEGGGVELHANLRAPVLIDIGRRVGYQHVLPNPRYPVRYRLDGAAASSGA